MRGPVRRIKDVSKLYEGLLREIIDGQKTPHQAELREAILELNARMAAIEAATNQIRMNLSEARFDLTAGNVKVRDPRDISRSPGQVHSQVNEDGVISSIFHRIGVESRRFLEIAAGNGSENTTRLLLESGWNGIWIEGDVGEAASARAAAANYIEAGKLVLLENRVTKENIKSLLAPHLVEDLDLLSLDVDYNTSHIWRALDFIRPRIVCIEYNAHYPPHVEYEVPYDPNGAWQGDTSFGASLKSLESLGREMGYSLVGCDYFGVNAYFVRSDLCSEDAFLAPFTAEFHYEPPRFSAVQMRGHRRMVR